MDIIKKLGIERPDYIDGCFIRGDGNWIEYEEYLKLEQQRNEMLEALIDDIQSYEFSPGDMFPFSNYKRNKSIFQKATGKTWEEIKELIK